MKNSQQWFDDYAISHQHKTNILIHYICVPLIFFSIIGLLMSMPKTFLKHTFGLYNPLLENWSTVFGAIALLFYLRLGFWYFLEMLFVLLLCIVGNFWLGKTIHLLYASIIIFVVAWIGQFYGHHLERKKPSFLKDLQFLLIGPLWVIRKITT